MEATRVPKCRAPAGNTATVNINVSPAATPTPAPASVAEATPTPIPNIWDAPSTSGWGLAAREYGVIPVAREEGAKALRAMIREANRFLDEGRPIVIFPEGTRVAHGTSPPLGAGFAALYKLLGLPVVPVAVDSGPTYHRRWKQPGTITYHFGEAIEPGLPRAEIEARTHAAMNALNQQLQGPAAPNID